MKTALLLHEDTLKALDVYAAKPSQTLLITGMKGVGKSILVRELTAAILGVEIDKLALEPYVRVLEPVDGKIHIETVRSLATFVQLVVPGNRAIARVICIVDADTLTREAQNALLKLLEEPPEHTLMLLTSSNPKKLLATILSRTQKLQVRLPSEEEILSVYSARGFEKQEVKKAYMLAAGSLAKMNELLERPENVESDPIEFVKQVLTAEPFTRLAYIDSRLKDKQAAKDFIDTLVVVASASLRASTGLERWGRILEAAVTAQKVFAQNGNPKLVLSELMLAL